MLDRYIIIDVEQMIADYDDNKVTLDSIGDQYTELCEKDIGSIDYSKDRVQTTPEENAMANSLIRKEDLKANIKELAWFFRVYDPAWHRLTDDEKYILTECCKIGYRNKQDAMDNICQRFNIEISKAYSMRRKALDRFKRLMFGN